MLVVRTCESRRDEHRSHDAEGSTHSPTLALEGEREDDRLITVLSDEGRSAVGEVEADARSLAETARDARRAAVQCHDAAYDRQTEPTACCPSAINGPAAHIAVEDVRQELRRDSFAGVADHEHDGAV